MPCPPMPTPEAQARESIDAMLIAADCAVQDYKQLNFSAARGIALREVRSYRCTNSLGKMLSI